MNMQARLSGTLENGRGGLSPDQGASIVAHHGRLVETDTDHWFVSADRRTRFPLEDFVPEDHLVGTDICVLREMRADGWWSIHAIYRMDNGDERPGLEFGTSIRG